MGKKIMRVKVQFESPTFVHVSIQLNGSSDYSTVDQFWLTFLYTIILFEMINLIFFFHENIE